MPCSASATCVKPFVTGAAITSSRSKRTNPHCYEKSNPPSPRRRRFPPGMQQQFEAAHQSAETFDKGHGRREHRRLESTTILNEHLDWPGVTQVIRLTRTVTRHGQTTKDVQFGLTSVPRKHADASRLLSWTRGHWGIESCLHWRRDVTFGDDASRIRTDSAPQVFDALRNASISVLRSLGATNIAAALRENALKVDHLLTKLGVLKQRVAPWSRLW